MYLVKGFVLYQKLVVNHTMAAVGLSHFANIVIVILFVNEVLYMINRRFCFKKIVLILGYRSIFGIIKS